MPLDHRLPALFTALFSSIAVVTAALAGASCKFLERISVTPDDELGFDLDFGADGNLDGNAYSNSFGVLCEHELFPREGDSMWELSRVFLIVALVLGSTTAALAWAVASFLTPTAANWNGISVLAAMTAVVQVPVFVLFEAEPCLGDITEDSGWVTSGLGCRLGPGSYLLIVSDLCYIAVTVITQCLDRPRWGLDLDLWKVQKRGHSRSQSRGRKRYCDHDNRNEDDDVHLTSQRARSIVSSEDDDFYGISRILPAGEEKAKHSTNINTKNDLSEAQAKGGKKPKPRGFFARLLGGSSEADNMEVPAGETHSMSGDGDEEYDYENQLLHDLEIVRVLPPSASDATKRLLPSLNMHSDIHTPSTPTLSESGEGQEVDIGFHDHLVSGGHNNEKAVDKDRSYESFDAVIEGQNIDANGKAQPHPISWAIPPAAIASQSVGGGSFQMKTTVFQSNNNIVEQHQMIDSPSASLMSADNSFLHNTSGSAQNILDDLHAEEMIASAPKNSSNSHLPFASTFGGVAACTSTSFDTASAPLLRGSKPPFFAAACTNMNSDGTASPTTTPALVPMPSTVLEEDRLLTQKMKSDDLKPISKPKSKRLASLRKLSIFSSNKGSGYAQVVSDQSSDDCDFDAIGNDHNDGDGDGDSYEESYFNYYGDADADTRPPQGLQLAVAAPQEPSGIHSDETPATNANENVNVNVSQSGLTANVSIAESFREDEIKHIYDSLDQDANTNEDFDPFDCISIGSNHSDPGPISFNSIGDSTTLFISGDSSDQSTSFTDLFRSVIHSEEDIPWDNAFAVDVENLSYVKDDKNNSQEASSPSRSPSRGQIIRSRRPISPVGSINDHCSLLHMTIDEETEEDVNNELELNNSYALNRTSSTLSCPEQRSSIGPISTRNNKTTQDLLKKLERLKRTINVSMNLDDDGDPDVDADSNRRSDLPPLRPPTATSSRSDSDSDFESALEEPPLTDTSEADFNLDDCSDMLSELLNSDLQEPKSKVGVPDAPEFSFESFQEPQEESPDSTPCQETVLSEPVTAHSNSNLNLATVPAQLETSNNESWKELISPLKEKPRKDKVQEPWKELIAPSNGVNKTTIAIAPRKESWKGVLSTTKNPATPGTLDISDETSETGYTRSTMSFDSDDSSYETGPRQIRSKSVGRTRQKKPKHNRRSLSPTATVRRKLQLNSEGSSTSSCLRPSKNVNISSVARESRIRRLQQLRKGYLPLENDRDNDLPRDLSPTRNIAKNSPYRDPYAAFDPSSDPELTPKRKTQTLGISIDARNEGSRESDFPDTLFQPSLLDPEQPCPEFDNILNHLDLQLIDLNRPIGAEYGDEEGSM